MKIGLGTLQNYTSPKFWRRFVNIWTIILFLAIIWDFVTGNGLSGTIGPMAVIYTALLAIYSAEKEFRRWYDYYEGRHPGELYVIAWTFLLVSIFLIDIVLKNPYIIPKEVVSTYIAVIGILAITRNSRSLHSDIVKKKKK